MSLLLADTGSSTGVAYTLSGSAGSYTITGQSASFNVARALAGAVGSYTITGQSAGFKVTRALAGAAGSYSITGQSASFKVDRALAGSAGSYTITGQSGTFAYTPGGGAISYSLFGDSGSYSITGFSGAFGYIAGRIATEEQASNWQAFKKFKKQKLEAWQAGDFIETPKVTPEQVQKQREALGILPPETHRKAQDAVKRVVEAQTYTPVDTSAVEAIQNAQEQAAQDWIEAYRSELKDAYLAEALFREEVQNHRRKVARTLALLLSS